MERTYYLTPQERFEALGKQLLPSVPGPPAFSFRTCARSGSHPFLSGHGRNRAKRPPEFHYFGTMGVELTPEQGNVATRLVGLNLLRTVEQALGSLDRIVDIVEVVSAFTSAPGFTRQSLVLNGYSNRMVQIFGYEVKQPVRMAYAPSELPFNMAVPTNMIVEVAPEIVDST